MVRIAVLLSFALSAALAAPKTGRVPFELAGSCDPEKCRLPDCRCFSTDIPGGLDRSETPQFVLFTFDDAVTAANYEYYKEAFYGRKNPDGCAVSSTYYVSHEYTDYSKVHDLHAHGQEIALHSITHDTMTSYWQNLDVEDLVQEFGGERQLISHFANIPLDDIKGMRVPLLQLSGNNSFEALKETGLTYDCSWPTQTYIQPGLWPYTLDYKSEQDCSIGPCPDASIEGAWVIPMIDWIDEEGYICAMVDACIYIPTEVDELVDFFIENFNREYNGNRAPFGFYVHAAWFLKGDHHFEAYVKFIDYLQSLPDVYLVNSNFVLEWIKNPTSIKDGPLEVTCPNTYEPQCTARACGLKKGDEERWMTSCVSTCPAVYPWLSNPFGESQE